MSKFASVVAFSCKSSLASTAAKAYTQLLLVMMMAFVLKLQ